MTNASGRRLPNWIEAFCEYAEDTPSPMVFNKWSAISAIAGVLERKVWSETFVPFYPNIYVFIVGPAGVGKTVAGNIVAKLWADIDNLHTAPSNVSRASFTDCLSESTRSVLVKGINPPTLEFNHINVFAPELGVLLPTYEGDFMSNLTDMWDGNKFEERKRGSKLHILIDKPSVNILGCCTPTYLSHFLPEGAWELGFMSRVIVVYSSEVRLQSLFQRSRKKIKMYEDLLHDLRLIFNSTGLFDFTEAAAAMIDKFYTVDRFKTAPRHPRLKGYNERRTYNVLKLSIIAANNRIPNQQIEDYDVREAIEWLEANETTMPDSFMAMSGASDSKAIEESWYFIFRTYAREQKPVEEHRLLIFLKDITPSHNMTPLINFMVESRMLKRTVGPTGGSVYTPLEKPSSAL